MYLFAGFDFLFGKSTVYNSMPCLLNKSIYTFSLLTTHTPLSSHGTLIMTLSQFDGDSVS